MNILFTGGGTLGPVTPLLAVAEELRRTTDHGLRTTVKMLWIGTRRGPERKLVEEQGILFSWIWAPKWRRYFDVRNLFVPFVLLFATIWAFLKLSFVQWNRIKLSFGRPDVIVTAGGFVGVPIAWAAWFLHIPVVLHNQDVRWSLANKLTAPVTRKITYALPETVPLQWKAKAVWTGNPVREFIFQGNKEKGLRRCGFTEKLPTIMIIGGGTGAQRLNEIVHEALPALTKHYNVIHLTGRGKSNAPQPPLKLRGGEGEVMKSHYCTFDFVTHEIADLYAAADVVVTRAGMGVLCELAALGKPMIIVPIPVSHQEDNANYFKAHGAAVVMNQATLTRETLVAAISRLFGGHGMLGILGKHAKKLSKSNAAKRIADEVLGLAKK